MSSWSCCKEEDKEPPKCKPESVEVLKPNPKVKPLVVSVAYVLKHEEDDDEPGQQEQEKLRQEQEKQREEQEKQRREQEKQKQIQNNQESSGQAIRAPPWKARPLHGRAANPCSVSTPLAQSSFSLFAYPDVPGAIGASSYQSSPSHCKAEFSQWERAVSRMTDVTPSAYRLLGFVD
ncbi:hypothetical protein JRQ81_005245 [Phrynocephalus forsythii]|uniref:Uncharacterized protein n=1 Tax=Phrynocephalus forsythii TaxID=171643 RepID=A0A9Q0XGM8_9SAUR|nr:hypothetical protein JRQ81_005245 [Phrynocephalus forsythii]